MECGKVIKVDLVKVNYFNKEPGYITCIYGESGVGKSTLADMLKDDHTIVLDGDGVRYYINPDLDYSEQDRQENNRRIAKIAYYLYLQGFNVIISTVRADLAYEILKDKTHRIKLYHVEK